MLYVYLSTHAVLYNWTFCVWTVESPKISTKQRNRCKTKRRRSQTVCPFDTCFIFYDDLQCLRLICIEKREYILYSNNFVHLQINAMSTVTAAYMHGLGVTVLSLVPYTHKIINDLSWWSFMNQCWILSFVFL